MLEILPIMLALCLVIFLLIMPKIIHLLCSSRHPSSYGVDHDGPPPLDVDDHEVIVLETAYQKQVEYSRITIIVCMTL